LSESKHLAALDAFLRGDLRFADLIAAFDGQLEFSEASGEGWRQTSVHYNQPLELRVILTPDRLRPMLNAFLAWKRNEDELREWATGIQMIDAYSNPPDLSDEECDDHMAAVWELLADIGDTSSAESLRERVETGLADLAELEVWLSSRAV
jgi:hypothetical protein